MDHITPVLAGCETVAEAWVLWGQRAFRNAEGRGVTGLLFDGSWGTRGGEGEARLPEPPEQGGVLAMGGGTPTAPGVAGAIRLAHGLERAATVYLRTSPGVLRVRLEGEDNRNRPPLMGGASVAGGMRGDAIDEIEDVFAARDGIYRDLADLVIETDGLDEQGAVERIVSAFGGVAACGRRPAQAPPPRAPR
jgi:shikimate kinase